MLFNIEENYTNRWQQLNTKEMKTVKIRLLGLITLIALTSNFVMGQSDPQIRYTESAELFINDTPLNGKTKVKKLIANIGEPSKKVDYPSGETSYFYEDNGIVFLLKMVS